MNLGGAIVLFLSLAAVVALAGFCFFRLLTLPAPSTMDEAEDEDDADGGDEDRGSPSTSA